MDRVELREPDDTRRYVLQGLWLQRVGKPTAGRVRPFLEWALEIASGGHPLPPVGFVADVGGLAFGTDRGGPANEMPEIPGWPPVLARSYEDHVLGKLYADWTFERATDALRRYAVKEQSRGLAYVVRQVRERVKFGGVELPPAIIRGMLNTPGDELLTQGYDLLTRDGPMPLLVKQYEALVGTFRRVAEVLGPEDVIALEQRTALADLGQYVAHRQILQTAARIESRLPARPVRPAEGRKEVPTLVDDEDQYPVGGYSSIATKGSIESLLHSQLAYMEAESPDLFDTKFVRDELFYYSRDENQFLRRRRAFVFALYPDLASARFKDPELPAQRIVMVLSAVLAVVRRLTEWLSADALRFEVVFVRADGANPLTHERELMELLLRELIERGSAAVRTTDGAEAFAAECLALGRTSQLHVLTVSTGPVTLDPQGAVVTRLVVPGPRPELTDGHGVEILFPDEEPFEDWSEAVIEVLRLWV
jgi:hypothetical protein